MVRDTKDESAIGLAVVGLLVVLMAIFLGEVTGNVQPKKPLEMTHPDVASPGLHLGR